MPYFAYLLNPVRPAMVTDPTDDEKAVSRRHHEHLKSLHEVGRLVFAGRIREEGGLGVVVIEAADVADAQQIMEADPQHSEGTMQGCVRPINVAVFPP